MTPKQGGNSAITVIRWLARILAVTMAGLLLFMFFGYSLEGHGPLSGTLTPFAALGLSLTALYIIAMLVTLRRERAGSWLGAIALGSFFIIMFLGLLPGNVSGGFSAKGVLSPAFLALWLPVLLYLLCWGLEKRGSN